MHMLTCVYACVRVHIYSCTQRTEADNQQLPQLLPPCFLTQGLSWHWSASEPPLSASPAVRLQMHTVEFGLYVCPWGGRGCTMVHMGLWGQHGGQVGSLRLQCGSWESTSGGPYLLSHLAGQHLFLRPDPNSGPPDWMASTCCHLPQLHYRLPRSCSGLLDYYSHENRGGKECAKCKNELNFVNKKHTRKRI